MKGASGSLPASIGNFARMQHMFGFFPLNSFSVTSVDFISDSWETRTSMVSFLTRLAISAHSNGCSTHHSFRTSPSNARTDIHVTRWAGNSTLSGTIPASIGNLSVLEDLCVFSPVRPLKEAKNDLFALLQVLVEQSAHRHDPSRAQQTFRPQEFVQRFIFSSFIYLVAFCDGISSSIVRWTATNSRVSSLQDSSHCDT